MTDKFVVVKFISNSQIGYTTLANVQRDALKGEERLYEPLSRAFGTQQEARCFQEGFWAAQDYARGKFFCPPNLEGC